jgi:glycosyltransferase involved in cell wall biosynthesis
MNKINIVTPLRNELENVKKLISCISEQSISIDKWIIVENNSNDGSKEYLASIVNVPNVNNLIVLTLDTESPDYQLGYKYSRIVNAGFEYIIEQNIIGDEDYIGILDADSFPTTDYYEKLISSFEQDPSLGICSGRSRELETQKLSVHSASWVMGSCRLWRYSCFRECGYIIGPSADTLSLAKAELCGWKAYPNQDAVFYSREVGQRINFSYYGESAYFRGNTIIYASFRLAKYILKGKIVDGIKFYSGYVNSLLKRTPRVDDKELKLYFSQYLSKKLKHFLN